MEVTTISTVSVCVCVCVCVNSYLETCPPYVRVIKEEELWLYKNPVKHSTVTTPILFVSDSRS